MQILLTNDDGIFAPGLAALYKELVKIGDVIVVAPTNSQSGTSHTITFAEPLVCNKVDINGLFTGFSVKGSPADCVKLASMQLCKKPIDLVVSGINGGANVGINVHYSGTVAAAMEGAFLKIPAIAMSLAAEEQMDFKTAAKHCMKVLNKIMPLKSGHVININIPHLSRGKPKGVRVVPQATGGFHEYYIHEKDSQQQNVFQLAMGAPRFEESTNDTSSLMEGFISVTALAADVTDHEKTNNLKKIKW